MRQNRLTHIKKETKYIQISFFYSRICINRVLLHRHPMRDRKSLLNMMIGNVSKSGD